MSLVWAVVIVLILILCFRWPLLLVGAVLAIIWCYLPETQKTIRAGNWDCDLTSGPYGSRCQTGSRYCDREECEIRCLSEQEAIVSTENIRKFIIERGYKFPVPMDFLEKFLNSKNHRDFCRKHLFGKMVFMIKQPGVRDSILHSIAPHVNVFRMSIGHASSGLLTELAERTQYPALQEYAKRKAQSGEKCVIPVEGYDSVYPVFQHAGTTAIDLIDLGTIDPPHANAAIVNHGLKLITYFEPHVGVDYDYHKTVEEFLQPLGYQVDRTSSCPYGLQFLTGDQYCASWALFGAILSVMNPGIPQRELLGYFIGQTYMASATLVVFMYYLYTEFREIIESEKPTVYNYKNLKEETEKYKELVLKLENIKNQNPAFEHVLTAAYHVWKALESTYGKLTNFWILDSAETLRVDIELMIKHQSDSGETRRLSESCLQIVKRNFDLDLYGKKIHKYARRAEKADACVLF